MNAAVNDRKPKSYIRSTDGATMAEVSPHQFVNRKCLGLADPLDQKSDRVHREMARADDGSVL